MRAQRRRFVVEVKRGTSRSAFLSQDDAGDKFSNAEAALFGARGKLPIAEPPARAVPEAVFREAAPAKPAPGRILRDLHEPPPPAPPEEPAPARRGRKPGSKNKPKPVLAPPAPGLAAPGTASWPVYDPDARDEAQGGAAAVAGEDAGPASAPASAAPAEAPADAGPARARLRDRSTILRRYVLGTEPAPGQPGWRPRRALRRD